jgi:serine/threonine-protein kinase
MQKYASDWSPDGRLIVFSQWDPDSQSDIYAISVSDGKIFPVVHTPFWDLAARFSPDGKWITYVSRESGKDEVYVQKFPSGELKTRVSPNGGLMPVWSPDGRELFYITKDQVVFCTIEQREPLRLSAARPLFDLPPLSTLNPSYAPLPDGQRFLVAKRIDTSQMRVANVVVNWPALRR